MLHFSVPKISATQRAKHGWRGLALLASKPARPALHRRVALALTAAVDRSAAAELSDELKKPLQALREAGRGGALAAAEVISHYGARPETKLSALSV